MEVRALWESRQKAGPARVPWEAGSEAGEPWAELWPLAELEMKEQTGRLPEEEARRPQRKADGESLAPMAASEPKAQPASRTGLSSRKAQPEVAEPLHPGPEPVSEGD